MPIPNSSSSSSESSLASASSDIRQTSSTSASTSSITPVRSAGAAGTAIESSSAIERHTAVLAGSIVGALIALGLLIHLAVYLRRRHTSDRNEFAGADDYYWEKRFRQLEGDDETPGDTEVNGESKKLRVSILPGLSWAQANDNK